jgi:hypothetical protein
VLTTIRPDDYHCYGCSDLRHELDEELGEFWKLRRTLAAQLQSQFPMADLTTTVLVQLIDEVCGKAKYQRGLQGHGR